MFSRDVMMVTKKSIYEQMNKPRPAMDVYNKSIGRDVASILDICADEAHHKRDDHNDYLKIVQTL